MSPLMQKTRCVHLLLQYVLEKCGEKGAGRMTDSDVMISSCASALLRQTNLSEPFCEACFVCIHRLPTPHLNIGAKKMPADP